MNNHDKNLKLLDKSLDSLKWDIFFVSNVYICGNSRNFPYQLWTFVIFLALGLPENLQ